MSGELMFVDEMTVEEEASNAHSPGRCVRLTGCISDIRGNVAYLVSESLVQGQGYGQDQDQDRVEDLKRMEEEGDVGKEREEDGSVDIIEVRTTQVITGFPVDLEYCDSRSLAINNHAQFIGELCCTGDACILPNGAPTKRGALYLKAKIAKNVEGLDMTVFKDIVLARRAFLATIPKPSNTSEVPK